MGAKSKQYVAGLKQAIMKADTDVMRLQQFMIGIEGSRENITKAMTTISSKLKAQPTKSFEELAKTDSDLKKAGENYARAKKELDDYKVKFAKTVQESILTIAGAQVVITNFTNFLNEKAKTWNPFKKKSMGKSMAALNKAKVDLENLVKFLNGMVEMQKAKGNYA